MRVLVISHLYPSRVDSVFGSFVHSQVKALQVQGCDVQVLAPTGMAPFPLYVLKEKWRRFHNTPKQDKYQGVDVIYPRIIRTPGAAMFELSGLNYYYALKPYVLEGHKAQPFDVVHAQVAYPDGWAAARLAEDLDLPLVLTLHGQELQKIVNWSGKLRKMVEATLGKATAVAVPSAKMLALAEKHGVPKHKLQVIYNGLDPLPRAELPEDIKTAIQDKQVLLSVCHLAVEKGAQHNLEALHLLRDKHPNLVYLAVGDGPQRDALQERARVLGLEDRVIFAGRQPRDKVGEFYRAAHVFSMPSRDESFGIVYLEAMAAGLPVIGTQGEGIAPVISENKVGRLVQQGDVQDLARQISELLDPATGKDLGDRGRELAAGFNWQRNAKEMLAVYQRATGVKA